MDRCFVGILQKLVHSGDDDIITTVKVATTERLLDVGGEQKSLKEPNQVNRAGVK